MGEYDEVETSNLLIIDQNTFEVLHTHTFQPSEMAQSIASVRLGAGTAIAGPEYYVVGTAMVYPDEPEPKHGRIVVFEWQASSGKLTTIAEKELRSAPYELSPFNGNLVAAVGSTVRLLEWTAEREFRHECAPSTAYVTALFLKVKGDFILVGDLMRSLTLLVHKPVENTLEEIAHDYQPNWVTSIEVSHLSFFQFFIQSVSDLIQTFVTVWFSRKQTSHFSLRFLDFCFFWRTIVLRKME